MKKVFNILLLTVLISYTVPLFADEVKVTNVQGKVEVQRVDGNWYPLESGDFVDESEIISTGFYSDAVIEYKDSVMVLGALTRISLEKVSSSIDSDDIEIYLNVGAIRSKVNYGKGSSSSFIVKTPAVMASAKTSDFTVTSNGSVSCNDGSVIVSPNVNNSKKNKNSDSLEEYDDQDEDDDILYEEENETEEMDDLEESENLEDVEEAEEKTVPAKKVKTKNPAGSIKLTKSQVISILPSGMNTSLNTSKKRIQNSKNIVTDVVNIESETIGNSNVSNALTSVEVNGSVEKIVLLSDAIIF